MKKISYFLLLLFLLSCAPARFVVPLNKGEHAAGLNIGGHLFDYQGLTIPAPLSSVYYGYGFDSGSTFFAGLHLTSLAFGNFQTDMGFVINLLNQKQWLPGLSVSPAVNFVLNPKWGDVRMWPQLDANVYWQYGKQHHYFYLGVSNWFELTKLRAHSQEIDDRWFINPQIGHVFRIKTYDIGLELKFLAPSHENTYAFVPYRSITGDYGANGLYFYITKRF
ncbi:MAG TPA: hypothetical protein P5050_00990 [Bacteroidia bacterium]|nr:hypothetical protein [Bacteroidia bacterium]HRS57776.1 hypothetical protein [Bacteroidia bacterium]HRU67283.1 hypothetical protein [Bacteroidia bacterium]